MTLKQVADELGISKQQVYRWYIKYVSSDALRSASVIYLTEEEYHRCKEYFSVSQPRKTTSNEAHHDALIEVLQDEIEYLREENSQLRKLLDQQQQLQLGQQLLLDEKPLKKKKKKKKKH